MSVCLFTSVIRFPYGKICLLVLVSSLLWINCKSSRLFANSKNVKQTGSSYRERISINEGWRFMRYSSEPDKLIYDVRPEVTNRNDNIVADTKPTEAVVIDSSEKVLKKWILPSANDFIKDPSKHHQRPGGSPGSDFPFVQNNFNDNEWEQVNLPHDWAIKGPFYKEANAIVGGGMGRLPVHGVAWYRRKLDITSAGKPGVIKITSSSQGLKKATVEIKSNVVQ